MAPSEPEATAADSPLLSGAIAAAENPEPLNGLSASVALTRLASEIGPTRVTLDHILVRLGDRAFGIMTIILAAPNCLPMPPGTSTVFGIAIMLVALQVLAGRHRLWMPAFLRRRSVTRSDFRKVVEWFAPVLQRIERLCRPRATWITAGLAERLIGVVILALGFVIALPIPIVGQVPPAITIGILSVSLIERDGLAVVFGLVLALAVVALNFGVITAATAAAWEALVLLLGTGGP